MSGVSLSDNENFDSTLGEDLTPKKVRFRDKDDSMQSDMVIEQTTIPNISWRDKLVGNFSKSGSLRSDENEDFDILEGDILQSCVNGVPSISFSERINKILIQGMDNTVALKLLGRNIGFSVLQNKIHSLWKPSAPIHVMDIENGYFLVKFQNKSDYEKALSEGPWTIFGQYLTVQPWTMNFDPSQAYPNIVMAWIRLPGLPGYLYKNKILAEIGEMVGKVVKMDLNTDSRVRGRFARMAVYINLEKPLVSQILVNGRPQRVEYESLPTICFHCGRYGHGKENCSFRNPKTTMVKDVDTSEKTSENYVRIEAEQEKESGNFGPWMLVERRPKRKNRENKQKDYGDNGKQKEGSRFKVLNNREVILEINKNDKTTHRSNKGKDSISKNQQERDSGIQDNGRQFEDPKSKGKSKMVGPLIGLAVDTNTNEFNGPAVGSSLGNDRMGRVSPAAEQIRIEEQHRGRRVSAQGVAHGASSSAGNMGAIEGQNGCDFRVVDPGKEKLAIVHARPEINLGGNSPVEEAVEVGSLDTNKHTAVVFMDNNNNKILTQTLKYEPISKRSTWVSRGSGMKGTSRSSNKKFNKLQASDSNKFKNNGSPRVVLKESMNYLAENISKLIMELPGSSGPSGGKEKMKGSEIPDQ